MSAAEQACLAEWRRELLAEARGEVLEVGAGTGASIEFYPDSVSRLVLSEPDPHMRKQLSERVKQSRGRENSSIRTGSAEQIEAEDESFDCVVTSLVCCSVADLDAGLREIRRVLRVGGNFLFMEHVAAQAGSSRRRWQNRINPLWKFNGLVPANRCKAIDITLSFAYENRLDHNISDRAGVVGHQSKGLPDLGA